MENAAQHIEEGTYGAKVQSWRAASPRELLRAIMDEMPSANRVDLFAEFSKRVQHHQARDILEVVIEYWCINNHASLMARPSTRPRISESALVSTMRESIKARAVNMVLMELKMPTGKTLKKSTGAECAAVGGWLSRIAAKVGADQLVGAILTEADLHQLFEAES